MTSEEIKNENRLDSQYFWLWLKEIAYQLAEMNEQTDKNLKTLVLDKFADYCMKRNEALGSTVPPGSESALRGNGPCKMGEHRFGSGNPILLSARCERCKLTMVEILEEREATRRQPAGGPRIPDLAAEPDSTAKGIYCDRIVHAKTHHIDPTVPDGKISATFWLTDREYQALLNTPLPG